MNRLRIPAFKVMPSHSRCCSLLPSLSILLRPALRSEIVPQMHINPSRVVFEQLLIWSSIVCPGSDRLGPVDWRRRPPGIQSPPL
ncbi:hypothetical protein PVAP13_5KG505021 [Panicum virgatum]|uniref:Uncharacterized protein n=1 Tax=Panicum virgatum TaxID=38727 RepID=A0A8T0SJ17_PANVG|nr:hypothetical protein PVAP13_5KG505021 [Panicum virgatum]